MALDELVSELEELVAPAEAELPPRSGVNFSGSLDYIDRLPVSGSSIFSNDVVLGYLSGLGRDTDAIANTDSRWSVKQGSVLPRVNLLTDNRRFNPSTDFDPGELTPGAGRLQDVEMPEVRPPDWKWEEKYRRKLTGGRQDTFRTRQGSRLQFTDSRRLAICLRRKVRREIAFAFGFGGVFNLPGRFTPYSRVRCPKWGFSAV